jgi:hypothetical protein
VNSALGFVLFVVFTYYSAYLGFFTAVGWDTTLVTVSLLCLAAALLPLRKQLWDTSSAKSVRLGSIPVIVIAGLLCLFYDGVAVYAFTFTPIPGFGLPSTLILVATFIVPFAFYWVIRAVRTRQGIDMKAIFSTLPPE